MTTENITDEDLYAEDIDQDEDISGLTDWENEPSISDLKADFDNATSDHETHVGHINTWLDNLNMTGKAKLKAVKGQSSVQPKLIRKQAEWRYAALSEPFLSTEDIFNTAPVTFEDKEAAVQNGLVLNSQFNTKLDKIRFINDFVHTGVDEGTIIVRVGWDYSDKIVKKFRPEVTTIPVDDPALAAEMQRRGQVPEVEVTTGEVEEYDTTVVTMNQPTVDVCDYRNVTIDPTCEGDINKAKFVVYSFQSCIADLRASGKYQNLDQIRVTSATPTNSTDHSSMDETDFTFEDDERKLLVVFEYWGFKDIDNSGELTPIVGTWVEGTMIGMDLNPMPDQELPFVTVQYLPIRRSIYGEPDGALLEDNQKIVGAVTRGMVDLMGRSANGQVGSRKDALDVVNKRRFDMGLDYEYNADVDPTKAFHMNKFPEIPNSAPLMLNLQNADADSMTGVKSFSTGISGESLGTVATGVRGAMDAASKRELNILRRLAEGIKQVGRKIISMNSEFLEDEEIIRITNDEFVPVRRDDLAGEIDISLTISTAEADNEKASELAFMLQTNGPQSDPGETRLIRAEIARLRKMPVLAKMIEEYQPQPDPIAQAKAQKELELLDAQIINERAKGMENQVDVGLKQAKTQTEIGKARQLNSSSDKTDLDYLEQESGLTRQHEENMKGVDHKNALNEKAADSLLVNKGADGGYKSPLA